MPIMTCPVRSRPEGPAAAGYRKVESHRNAGGVVEDARFDALRRRHRGEERAEVSHGERARLDGQLAVSADRHDELAAGRQLLHAVVLPVGNVDVAVLVERNAPRLVELAVAAAGLSALGDKLALRREDLQAIVAAVDDDHVAVGLADNAGRPVQLAGATAGRA